MTEAGDRATCPDNNTYPAWIAISRQTCLSQKNPGTADVSQRIPRDFFLRPIRSLASSSSLFSQLTRTMVKIDLSALEKTGYSLNHRGRVMPVLSSFCQWLIDKQEPLKPNLACCLERLAQQVQAPRVLSEKQRFILRALVEQAQDLMGDALFTLGYWAGYRMSDLVRTPVGPPRCAVTLLSSYKKLAGQWRREPASLACQAEETLALQTIARSTRVSQEKKGCTSIQIPAFYTSQA